MPLAVSDMSLRIVRSSKPIKPVQLLNLSDLCLEKPDLFTENFKMIHGIRVSHLDLKTMAKF